MTFGANSFFVGGVIPRNNAPDEKIKLAYPFYFDTVVGGRTKLYNREYYLKNKEKFRENSRKYKLAHKDRIRAYDAAYRKKNKARRKELLKKWEVAHPELVFLQKQREWSNKHHGGQRFKIIEKYKGLCYLCGKDTRIKPKDSHVHHCAGRKNHKQLILLCASCHRSVHNLGIRFVIANGERV